MLLAEVKLESNKQRCNGNTVEWLDPPPYGFEYGVLRRDVDAGVKHVAYRYRKGYFGDNGHLISLWPNFICTLVVLTVLQAGCMHSNLTRQVARTRQAVERGLTDCCGDVTCSMFTPIPHNPHATLLVKMPVLLVLSIDLFRPFQICQINAIGRRHFLPLLVLKLVADGRSVR